MISWVDFLLVPVTMSIDSMTIGAVDGIEYPNLKKWKIILCSFLFGLFQMGMPIIGYFIGGVVQQFLGDAKELVVGWIAFSLLMLLSIKSFAEWIKDKIEDKKISAGIHPENETEEKKETELSVKSMFLQAVATSIDALSMGFVYMDREIGWAMAFFTTIGIVTWGLSLLAIVFGKLLGPKLNKLGGLIAGIVFALVAVKIILGAYGIINF